MRMEKIRPWLTRLYPRDWRLRYEAEFTVLLEECLQSPLDIVDVVLGAADAHLQVLSGESLNWRIMNMLNKIRTSILIAFAAYIGFIIAGFSLVGLADDSPMDALRKITPSISAAWTTVQAGAAVALLAVVIGGLPLAISLIRRALGRGHRGLELLMVPVAALLALAAYAAFVFGVWTGHIHIVGVFEVVPAGAFPPGNRLLMLGLMAVFVLGAIASTIAVLKAVSDLGNEKEEGSSSTSYAPQIKIFNFAFVPAVIASIAMAVMLAGTIAWGWISFSALPQALGGNYGPLGMTTQGWYFGIIALMAISTLAAILGVMRGRKARNRGMEKG